MIMRRPLSPATTRRKARSTPAVLGQLPIGLHLDSRSGAITGIARTVGKYQFQIQVSDESDPPMDAEAMLTLIVTGAP